MTTPPPPSILVTETGETLYYNPYSGTYTKSRSYGLRMQRGFQRGMRQQEARSHTPAEGFTERSERAQKFEAKYGVPLNYWESLRSRLIKPINDRTAPAAHVTLQQIADVKELFESGYRDPQLPVTDWKAWVDVRLNERLYAIVEYQDYDNDIPGRSQYFNRADIWLAALPAMAAMATAPALELWWYH